jgi:hypothetical protein
MAVWFYVMLGFVVIASAIAAGSGIISSVRSRIYKMRKKHGIKLKRYTGRRI